MKIIRPKNQCIEVPLWFIMDYMPKAPSGYTHVYLYLLALSHKSQKDVNLERVAKTLKMLYSEVLSALGYWNEQGVINYKEDEELIFLTEPLSDQISLESLYGPLISDQSKEFESSMELSNMPFTTEVSEEAASASALKTIEEPTMTPVETVDRTSKPAKQRNFLRSSRPNYTTEEIGIYKQGSSEYSNLIHIAEDILGPISTEYQKLLYGLYDWLGMSFELIECLLRYCAKNKKTSIRYIETTAIGWIEQDGITTVEQAETKILKDKRYYEILKKLGIKRDVLTPIDKEFIDKWLNTWAFDIEMVLKACEKTVAQTTNPSLNYTDKILSTWYHDNIKSLNDIEVDDKAYHGKKAIEASTAKGSTWITAPKKKTRFNTMDSRTWDFDELDRLEEEYINRKLNGRI